MDKIIHEHTLAASCAVADDNYHRVDELLNADFLILTKIKFLGNGRYCNMRVVDCASGVVVSAARVKL